MVAGPPAPSTLMYPSALHYDNCLPSLILKIQNPNVQKLPE
jgi:hypothetical protein